jgi:hypothetical protein
MEKKMLEARELVKLKKLEKMAQFKEEWCEEQQTDLENTFRMMDELIAYAIASSSSAQAYIQLEEARSSFKRHFLDMSSRYRHT